MNTILTVPLSQLHNGEHYEFEQAVLDVFTPIAALHVNLTDRCAQLQQTHNEEAEVYRTNQGYRQTKKHSLTPTLSKGEGG